METYNSNIIMGNTQDQSVFHSIWCGSKVFDVSQRLRPQNPGRTDRKLDTLMCGKAKKADNGGIEQPKESWRRWTKYRCLLDDSAKPRERKKHQFLKSFCVKTSGSRFRLDHRNENIHESTYAAAAETTKERKKSQMG
jgi:hypothetical protein